jgi:UDP-N-acetylmuramoyl-L-alanyl-D-glutamate--2,6-diaminopimelate ligase
LKALSDILFGCKIKQIQGNDFLGIDSIHIDSRNVVASSLFIAVKGYTVNGHDYVEKAVENGALALVVQVGETLPELDKDVCIVWVEDSQEAVANIASNFYDNPSKKLKLVGVTGTNGKTTVATLLHSFFSKMGYQVGLVSTVRNLIGKTPLPSTHTTPDAISFQKLLADMVDAGCEFCFMEVSSHAIHQKRTAATHFVGGIFTNISHDHLDYHKTFKEYIRVKKQFFDELPKSAFALSNADDSNGAVMLQNTRATKKYYGIKYPADYKCKVLENTFMGLVLQCNGVEYFSPFIGRFNALNLTAVVATANCLGVDLEQALMVVSSLAPVDGRFQHQVTAGKINVIVDYAHTPDALENVLKTVNDIRTNNETLTTIIGCGGDRDKLKRPLMAKVAVELSDRTILTSDNPRTEVPASIINDMKEGVPGEHFMRYSVQEDRAEAIKSAMLAAKEGDIVLIAGKGHETYQDIQGVKHPFNDLEIAMNLAKLIN